MANPCVQYAKALYESLINPKDFQPLFRVISEEFGSPSVIIYFEDPSISNDVKKQFVKNVLTNIGAIPQDLLGVIIPFLYVLIDNARISEIKEIYQTYAKLIRKAFNQKEALIHSRYPMSDEQIGQIREYLVRQYNCEILLETIIDGSVVGGFRVMVEKTVIDTSFISQLSSLKNTLKEQVIK